MARGFGFPELAVGCGVVLFVGGCAVGTRACGPGPDATESFNDSCEDAYYDMRGNDPPEEEPDILAEPLCDSHMDVHLATVAAEEQRQLEEARGSP